MAFYESLVEWSNRVWPLLANHLWQATLFALFVLALSFSLKRAPARVRYSLWLIALAKFALPSAAIGALSRHAGIDLGSLFAAGGNSQSGGLAISPLLSPVASPPIVLRVVEPAAPAAGTTSTTFVAISHDNTYWYALLVLLWAAGCALLLCLWLRRRGQLSAAIQSGTIVNDGRESKILERVRSCMKLRRRVTLVVSERFTEPGVWRVFRPVVVLPAGIPKLLDEGELETVLMHEMVHVERWDNLVSIFQRVVCCALWFHPLVWLLDKKLTAEREQSCDDTVIKMGGDSGVYAASIAKVCRYSIGWEVSGLSSAGGSNLKQRIKRIVAADVKRSPSALQRALVVAVFALVVVLTAATGLIRPTEVTAQGGSNDVKTIDARFIVSASEDERGNLIAGNKASAAKSRLIQEPRDAGQQIKAAPAATVVIKGPADLVENNASTLSVIVKNKAQDLQPQADIQPPPPISAAIIPASDTTRADLRAFVGRYEVDPSRVENFVIDITLERSELWLKPSHAAKRRLMQTSEMSFSDAYSQFRLTCIQGAGGAIVGLRLDSWGDILARKLMLPQPSVRGKTTFRLKGYANARIVALAGTFNNWNQSQLLFAREGDEWVCRVNLPPGSHQYKFIVDGDWITDPSNPKTAHDDRGIMNSLWSAE